MKIYGKWNTELFVKQLDNAQVAAGSKASVEEKIWTANAKPPNCDALYNFTYFALQLNYLPEGMKELLPPTDSRLRPD